jgi:hypothetical protein
LWALWLSGAVQAPEARVAAKLAQQARAAAKLAQQARAAAKLAQQAWAVHSRLARISSLSSWARAEAARASPQGPVLTRRRQMPSAWVEPDAVAVAAKPVLA